MTDLNLRDGEHYILTMTGDEWTGDKGRQVEVVVKNGGERLKSVVNDMEWWGPGEEVEPGYEFTLTPVADPVNPTHYVFPSGVETIQISEWLSANGAQAMQYVVRATRVDGKTKGNEVEDLRKALWFVQREIDRLETQ